MSKYTHTTVLSSHTVITIVQEPINTSSLLTGVITIILQSVPCLYEHRFIIIILGISFMQSIYTYITETDHVPREHCVATILM